MIKKKKLKYLANGTVAAVSCVFIKLNGTNFRPSTRLEKRKYQIWLKNFRKHFKELKRNCIDTKHTLGYIVQVNKEREFHSG